jgi:hypothetical protein
MDANILRIDGEFGFSPYFMQCLLEFLVKMGESRMATAAIFRSTADIFVQRCG